jgi:fatty acid desaturase
MADDQYLGGTRLFPQATYVHEIKPALPAAAFKPAHTRVLWIPVHLAVIVTAMLAIARGWVPWPVVPVMSLVIGISFACLTFVAHEAMHGGVVRGKRAKYAIAWLGFLHFGLSPRLWAAWHDRVHHANANLPNDPDMYPTLVEYRASSRIRFFVDAFSLGCRRWRGGLSLVLGFTVQSAHQLISSERRGFLTRRQRRLAIAESMLAIAIWGTLAALVGFLPFWFMFVMPHVVANIVVMAFILTNHALSPKVGVNDPLITGLSVTVPRWIEWLTLRFGYHVEHHIFPAMSSRHAHLVRAELRARWPERYQAMPLGKALAALHRTARIYKDDVTLVDPKTGEEFPTLMPRTSELEAQRSAPRASATSSVIDAASLTLESTSAISAA